MLHCDGKCYLAKQLKKLEQEEKKNQSVPKMPLKLKETIWNSVSQVITIFEKQTSVSSKESPLFFYQNRELASFSGSTFHPPTIA